MACPVIIIFDTRPTGNGSDRRSAGIPPTLTGSGVVATNPHMETVDIQPRAFFRVQQMAMAGFHQLLLTVAADVELEVAAPLVWAIIQFARPAAQTVFAREDVWGYTCLTMADPSGQNRPQ